MANVNENQNKYQDNFSSASNNTHISFEFTSPQPSFGYAKIIISAKMVDILYDETARAQQHSVHAYGFNRGQVPLEYIKQNFEVNLLDHMKEFFLKYSVLNTLFREIRIRKIPIAGEPRLIKINIKPGHDADFLFEISLLPKLEITDWKYLPFKAPRRKNYKDLDRQVESFVKEERNNLKSFENKGLSVGDWVNFSIALVDQEHIPLFDNYTEDFWFKIGDEKVDNPIRELFLGKSENDVLYTTNRGLQEYFSNQLNTIHYFCIKIIHIVPHAFFCFDTFKRHFRIKTNIDMNRKMIEVFSYRNDLSQRRSMVEDSLKLLLSKNNFDIPNYLVLREQNSILEMVKQNPDYNVYRVQKDFRHRIRQLAEKTIKEKILIDQLAYQENISIYDQDVKSYLNLILRQRTKEFIYFEHPEQLIEGQEIPIPSEELKQTCLREKTINYAIYHLTKK